MAFITNSLNFPNLTSKASPTVSDLILIADAAASNALKQATLSSLPFAPAGGFTAVDVNTATQTLAINSIYLLRYAAGACTFTLPSVANSTFGASIIIAGVPGVSASNFIINYTTNQYIDYNGNATMTTTGNLTSTISTSVIKLTCADVTNKYFWKVEYTSAAFTGA